MATFRTGLGSSTNRDTRRWLGFNHPSLSHTENEDPGLVSAAKIARSEANFCNAILWICATSAILAMSSDSMSKIKLRMNIQPEYILGPWLYWLKEEKPRLGRPNPQFNRQNLILTMVIVIVYSSC